MGNLVHTVTELKSSGLTINEAYAMMQYAPPFEVASWYLGHRTTYFERRRYCTGSNPLNVEKYLEGLVRTNL